MGSSTENSAFGARATPGTGDDPRRLLGRSAAAVAAGECLAALGSDTGGSIRQPAACCGVAASSRPTAASRATGSWLSPPRSTRSAPWPDRRGLRDPARGDRGPRPPRLDVRPRSGAPVRRAPRRRPPRRADRGIVREFFAAGIDAEVDARGSRGGAGPRGSRRARPRGLAAPREALGGRLLHPGDGRGLLEPRALRRRQVRSPRGRRARPARAVPAHARRGLRARGAPQDHARHLRALLRLLRRLLPQGPAGAHADPERLHRGVPRGRPARWATAPTRPSASARRATDPLQMYLSDIFTISVNLAGVPGPLAPLRLHAAGLPIGLQLIGPASARRRCCAPATPTSSRRLAHEAPAPGDERVMSGRYEIVIGLEVHAQLLTRTKIFCRLPDRLRRAGEHPRLPGLPRLPACCPCSTAPPSSASCAPGSRSAARSRRSAASRARTTSTPTAQGLSDLAVRAAGLHRRRRAGRCGRGGAHGRADAHPPRGRRGQADPRGEPRRPAPELSSTSTAPASR